MNSGSLSERMWAGIPRVFMRRMSSSITSCAVMLRLHSRVGHSRVYSSTIESHFKERPPSSRSKMKSSAQMWFLCSGRWRWQAFSLEPRRRRLCCCLGTR